MTDQQGRPIDYAPFDFFTMEIDDEGIALLTMNDPDRLNAIGGHNHWQLEDIWLTIARDERIKVIVLTGAGRAFSAGGDIKLMAERVRTDEYRRDALSVPMQTMRFWDQLLSVPQPIIAAVNGDAIGLGTSLFAFCDISIVAEDAKIGDTHVRVGLVTGDGGSIMWPLLVGPQRAKEYLMRGKLLTGAKAAEIGLVNHAFPRDQVMAEAFVIAREIAAQPIWAVRWSKAAVNKQLKAQVNMVGELSIAYEAMTLMTQDHAAAVEAFARKETPVFTGD